MLQIQQNAARRQKLLGRRQRRGFHEHLWMGHQAHKSGRHHRQQAQPASLGSGHKSVFQPGQGSLVVLAREEEMMGGAHGGQVSTTSEEEGSGSGGPVLNLLARGLELWLRQQCEAIGTLQIQLQGSAARLLRGRLEGVALTAEGVSYQAFAIDRVDLHSDPIRVRLGPLLRHQRVELENGFGIRGWVGFSATGLDRSLRSGPWQPLGDELARQLLGQVPLRALLLEEDRLVLVAGSGEGEIRRAVRLSAAAGTVELRSLEGDACVRLPMDPSIRIEEALVRDGELRLRGEAQVSP
jgi:hypothetical protein